ncbi:hypothetical protein [Kocuria sp.]|uniref:hypothetical protein n=1 Tax=Kocuria sp. TaxID=1871328 RepID=UPI0026DC8CA8|nr:hypothetical protein [Kocuria sp.]MDO4918814.1 hypothetical protein [Kocuria sp.]
MTQPIPDPNPLDNPEAVEDTFREDELIETTGDEDSAWEEDAAQWGEDADPLRRPEEADVEQIAEEETIPEVATVPETQDPEVEALVTDPQADREVNRSLEDGAAQDTDPME